MSTRSYRNLFRKAALACLLGAGALSQASAQAPTAVAPGTPVTINFAQAKPDSPPVSINLRDRSAKATPVREGCTHTGGGIIDVQQPSSDVLVITMGGVAVAYGGPKAATASMIFDLNQCFEVSFDSPKVKRAKISLEGRVIGLLRSHCKGGVAEFSNACATVSGPAIAPLSITLAPHSVTGGENLSINDRVLSEAVVIPAADKYSLHQTFIVTASAPKCLLQKAPSAEFAPDPALDPLWISYKEPFKGAAKKDYGFQVTVRIADDTPSEPEKKDGNAPEKKNGNSAPVMQAMPTPAPNAPMPMPAPMPKH